MTWGSNGGYLAAHSDRQGRARSLHRCGWPVARMARGDRSVYGLQTLPQARTRLGIVQIKEGYNVIIHETGLVENHLRCNYIIIRSRLHFLRRPLRRVVVPLHRMVTRGRRRTVAVLVDLTARRHGRRITVLAGVGPRVGGAVVVRVVVAVHPHLRARRVRLVRAEVGRVAHVVRPPFSIVLPRRGGRSSARRVRVRLHRIPLRVGRRDITRVRVGRVTISGVVRTTAQSARWGVTRRARLAALDLGTRV